MAQARERIERMYTLFPRPARSGLVLPIVVVWLEKYAARCAMSCLLSPAAMPFMMAFLRAPDWYACSACSM